MAEEARRFGRAISQARRLRKEATPAERALWRWLRESEVKFRRQAPIGPYIADFACLKAQLIVELDGGAHNAADVQRRDAKREAWLREQGYRVHRLMNEAVMSDPKSAAAEILALIPSPLAGEGQGGGEPRIDRTRLDSSDATQSIGRSPHPYPSPRGGGVRKSAAADARPSRKRKLVAEKDALPPENLILVGAITGAFGVRGELRVKSFTAALEDVCAYGPLLDESGALVLTPKSWRPLKDAVAMTAKEVKTREQAEAMRGTALYVPREALPAPEEDEFYAADLIGCAVVSVSGAPLGEVTAVTDYGAGDMLEIVLNGAVWRLPFTQENTPQIDLKSRRIIADPPKGLLPE
ncbi:MAG TPA: ribosome maturation factor RimM [Caulobacterales bacterium]|nr:ribosome maturation factor RimM [Caulobacterales bacterium]